jgi:protein-S-isoprenylcysteine O-methyltransferase Ste14
MHGLQLVWPQTPIHLVLAGAAVAAVTFFGVGLTGYFERTPRPVWVLVVHYVSMLLALLQTAGVIFLKPRSDFFASIGIGMFTLSIALYLAAIEAAQRTRLQRSFIDHPLPDRLITHGPFCWVRHPFCTGYLLGALAPPIAMDDLRMIAISLPLVAITFSAAIREERVWLASPRGDEYREYRKRTGMFIPFIGRK